MRDLPTTISPPARHVIEQWTAGKTMMEADVFTLVCEIERLALLQPATEPEKDDTSE